MMTATTSDPSVFQGKTLVAQVTDALRSQIAKGRYNPGDRLPSEAQLTQEFGVSRTVVREAIAALRSDGLVEPRQGAGVFLLEQAASARRPFQQVDLTRVSSLIEMLELRTAVEGDAAALAALRRSPGQEGKLIEAFDAFRACAAASKPTAEADSAFTSRSPRQPTIRALASFLRRSARPSSPVAPSWTAARRLFFPLTSSAALWTNTKQFS